MTMQYLQQAQVQPNHADGARFSLRVPMPNGVLKAIRFRIQGTTVGTTGANDDAIERLISDLKVTFPLYNGPVISQLPGRDVHLLGSYFYSAGPEEKSIPTSATTFFSSFILPLCVPKRICAAEHKWGIERAALTDEIIIEGNWNAASDYGAGTTSITNGILQPELIIDDEPYSPDRLAIVATANRIAVESAARHGPFRLSKGQAAGLLALLFRAEDDSAAADRQDGLVTRYRAEHSLGPTVLCDNYLMQLRQEGIEWAGIGRTLGTGATPEGYDGTALVICNPELARDAYAELISSDISLFLDSQETVPNGTTDVTPASGDAVHCSVVGVVRGSRV